MLPHVVPPATIARTRRLDSAHLPTYLQRISSFGEESWFGCFV